MAFNFQFFTATFPAWVLLSIGFIFSFAITFYGIPSIVKIARIKELYDVPGNRTSHEFNTPRLGGTIIFAGVILSSILFTGLSTAHELKYIIAGMIVLFFIGIKDDIVSLVPLKKAMGQLLASIIIVVPGDIHLIFFSGFFANSTLGIAGDMIISLFIVMALINSINFIDGIDGLASGVGIMASILFGIWFIQNEQISYGIICFSLSGSLLAFSYYNLFSKAFKIFLGDTGSMLIGFLLAVFVIRFVEINSPKSYLEEIQKVSPSIALAILFVPVFDTIRICIVRIINGKSIFRGDNNHIHHKVLRLSGSHLKATIIILVINLFIIMLTYLLRSAGNTLLILFLLFLGTGFSVLLGGSLKHS